MPKIAATGNTAPSYESIPHFYFRLASRSPEAGKVTRPIRTPRNDRIDGTAVYQFSFLQSFSQTEKVRVLGESLSSAGTTGRAGRAGRPPDREATSAVLFKRYVVYKPRNIRATFDVRISDR